MVWDTGTKTRRIIAVVLVVSLTALSGCGGSGNAERHTGGTEKISGSVDTNETGGSGLEVMSVLAEPAGVRDGQFSTTVSDHGVQLLFCCDRAGELRSLALSIPGVEPAAASGTDCHFNAESTALSLLFLAPGVMALAPDEGSTRAEELKSYASFEAIVSYLRQELPARPLSELLGEEDTLASLIGATVEEFAERNGLVQEVEAAVAAIEGMDVTETERVPRNAGGVWLYHDNSGFPEEVNTRLENHDWRYMAVHRRALKTDGTYTPWVPIASNWPMSGATQFSLGSMITGRAMKPTVTRETVSFDDVRDIEYWIQGPGALVQEDVTRPSDLPENDVWVAWAATSMIYLVLPIFGILTGSGSLKINPAGIGPESGLYRLCRFLVLNSAWIAAVEEVRGAMGGGWMALAKELTDLTVLTLDLAAGSGLLEVIFAQILKLSDTAAGNAVANIVWFLRAVLLACSGANLRETAISLNKSYRLAVLKVEGKGLQWKISCDREMILVDGQDWATVTVEMKDLDDVPWLAHWVNFRPGPGGSVRTYNDGSTGFWQTMPLDDLTGTDGRVKVHFKSEYDEAGSTWIRVDIKEKEKEGDNLASEVIELQVVEALEGNVIVHVVDDPLTLKKYSELQGQPVPGAGEYEVWVGDRLLSDKEWPQIPNPVYHHHGYELVERKNQTATINVLGYDYAVIGTRSGLLLDALTFPDGKQPGYEWFPEKKLGYWTPDGWGASNIHAPLTFDNSGNLKHPLLYYAYRYDLGNPPGPNPPWTAAFLGTSDGTGSEFGFPPRYAYLQNPDDPVVVNPKAFTAYIFLELHTHQGP